MKMLKNKQNFFFLLNALCVQKVCSQSSALIVFVYS